MGLLQLSVHHVTYEKQEADTQPEVFPARIKDKRTTEELMGVTERGINRNESIATDQTGRDSLDMGRAPVNAKEKFRKQEFPQSTWVQRSLAGMDWHQS